MVALTNTVVRGEPFHCTTEFVSKPVPVSVIVAACPAGTIFGAMELSTGVGLVTSKGVALLAPPPGARLCTVTALVELPAVAEAGSIAFNSVPLTHEVVSAAPFQSTADDGTKPLPETVSVCWPDPAATLAGLTPARTGGGLFTVKFAAAELPPPGAGLKTVIAADTPSARLLAGTVAFNEVSVENVVTTAVPFHRTADPLRKPVPVTKMERSSAPAIVVDGVTLVIAGTPLSDGAGGVDGVLVPPHPIATRVRKPRQATARERELNLDSITRALPANCRGVQRVAP